MLSPALSLRLLQLPVKSANVVLFVVDARTRASSTARSSTRVYPRET
jgi:hypothetical protein